MSNLIRLSMSIFHHHISKFIGGALGGGYIYDLVSGLF
jgi:hypothetical protein